MELKADSIVEGVVGKITRFGAFIGLPNGKSGLLHISQIADACVRDIGAYLKEGDRVCVKILSVGEKGRYELSLRHIPAGFTPPAQDGGAAVGLSSPEPPAKRTDWAFQDKRRSKSGKSFEELLLLFKRESDERQLDIKRRVENKRGMARKPHRR